VVFRIYPADVSDRARAAMLGLAIGDALGATVEFLTRSEIRAQYGVLREIQGGGWLHLRPGEVTDDTQMSLCIARSIDEVGWSPADIAERFATWLRSRPPDVGNTCRRGIRRYLQTGLLEVPPNEGDAGNGAAMRMVPVAIASLADTALLERWAVEQAHLTHHHPLSDAACALVGRLLHLACIGHSWYRLRREAQGVAARFPALEFTPYRGLSTAYVADTLPTVLHYFFTTRSFEECLIATVNQGGDADTTGAIVGALAGAYYGSRQIPERWIRQLDRSLVGELSELSRRLLDRSPLAQGRLGAIEGAVLDAPDPGESRRPAALSPSAAAGTRPPRSVPETVLAGR
jgi:ADP-ribosyl-[dinitrogen reductase] hydrolase